MSEAERTVIRSDFHVPHDSDDEPEELELSIEARLEFPELAKNDDVTSLAVPEFFNQMIVDDVGNEPFCRVRLEAKWFATSLTQGDVEQKLYWITTPEAEPEEEKHPMSALQRSQIHAIYVPAARDPSRQLRSARGSTFGRLLRSIKWSKKIRSTLEENAQQVLEAFGDEPAIETVTEVIRANWNELQNLSTFEDPTVRPLNPKFESLVRNLEFVFNPNSDHQQNQLEALSEGLQSLFYLALMGMMFDLEERLLEKSVEDDDEDGEGQEDQDDEEKEDEEEEDDADGHGISLNKLNPPSLVILNIEEPENHLAPHYLGRIMQRLLRLSQSPRGQVLLSSHSPSIMSRIEPTRVRYLRLNSENETEVHEILLPAASEDAFKYVNDAVRTHPELYFSTMVVLGEGDSESVVLPRLAESLGVPLDRNFVSFVPLGGRHVNYFWKLLSDLHIPYITLLDMDLGREGGGWGRIKYACNQLLRVGKDRKKLLATETDEGKESVLSDTELKEMHTWGIDTKEDVDDLEAWRNCLEDYDVFFSYPLDLDFALLRKFSSEYKKIVPTGAGPSIPKAGTKQYDEKLSDVVKAIFKSGVSESPAYKASDDEFFFWYRYLFLGRGKPTTHFQAMANILPTTLAESAPSELKRLVKKMQVKLKNQEQA